MLMNSLSVSLSFQSQAGWLDSIIETQNSAMAGRDWLVAAASYWDDFINHCHGIDTREYL